MLANLLKGKGNDDDFVRSATVEKEDFRENFVDYDMSSVGSAVSAVGERVLVDSVDETEQFQDKWDYRSTAPYYTDPMTRNAQTVSHKQRHRPIFQLFVDFNFAILATTALLMIYLIQLRRAPGLQVDTVLPRTALAGLYFAKFFTMAAWYRCSGRGNVTTRTKTLFWLRLLCDLVIIGYQVWLVLA